MANMVRVACRVPNGVMLRLYGHGFDDGTGDGVKPIVAQGAPVLLAGLSSLETGAGGTDRLEMPPVTTLVDEAWISKWMEQNKLNPLVMQGMIFVIPNDPD